MISYYKNKGFGTDTFKVLYPFESHFQSIRGRQYHYVDEGQGEPVVMVHGNPTWSFYYRSLIKGLSSDFRTIAPDHIGCGLSEKPNRNQYAYQLSDRIADLDAFLDALNLKEKITLVVHDWGGMIGMAWAAENPDKIARIIITNTAAFLMSANKRLPFRLQVLRNFRPFSTIAVQGLNLFARGALYMAAKKPLPKAVRRGLIAPYNSWSNRIATLRFVEDIPLTPKDSSFKIVSHCDQHLHTLAHIPMLICWGMHDFVFDSDYLDQWRRRFPGAEIHEFQDAGHYLLEDVPHKVLPIIRIFLNQHPITKPS